MEENRLIAGLTSCIVFVVYCRTMYLSIPGGDSGELLAETCNVGVIHPPGYPLFMIVYGLYINFIKTTKQLMCLITSFLGWDNYFNYFTSGKLSCAAEFSVAWHGNFLSVILSSISLYFLHLSMQIMLSTFFDQNNQSIFHLRTKNVSFNLQTNKVPTKQSRTPCSILKRKSEYLPYSNSSMIISSFCCFTLGFSRYFWLYSVGVEVFPLNNLLVSLLVYIAMKHLKSKNDVNLYKGAVLCGLGLCNQHTIILIAIPFILFFGLETAYGLRHDPIMLLFISTKVGIFFALGLSPYAYIVLAWNFFKKEGSWGRFDSIQGVWNHFIRADYGTFKLWSADEASETVWLKLRFFLECLCTEQFTFVFFILGCIGFFYGVYHRLKPIMLLFGALAFNVVFFSYFSNLPFTDALLSGINKRFYVQPSILFVFLAASGLYVCCSCNVWPLWNTNFLLNDNSDNDYFEHYAKALMGSVPANSILLTNYDQQWTSMRYVQKCLGYRAHHNLVLGQISMFSYGWMEAYEDAFWSHADLYIPKEGRLIGEALKMQGYVGFTLWDLYKQNKRKFPGGIYVGGTHPRGLDLSPSKLVRKPYSVFNKVYTVGYWSHNSTKREERYLEESRKAWKKLEAKIRFPAKHDAASWEGTINTNYYLSLIDWATEQLKISIELKEYRGIVRYLKSALQTEKFFKEALEPETLKNIGIAFKELLGNNYLKERERLNPLSFYNRSSLSNWRDLAANKTVEYWTRFVSHPKATTISNYDSVRGILAKLKPGQL
eukprot:maker-scaffold_2-snap-gene-25.64-mRNA-1 protein AED:0.37 eAED:0.37 QI:0/0/0/0.33/1/1/3/0/770